MKNTLIRTKNTVSAPYLPYAAYKSAIALATAHKGKIDKTAEGNFKATFNSVKTAEKFVAEWTAQYEANRKVEVAPAPKSTPAKKSTTSKPTATKGKAKATASSTKKTVKTDKKPKASKGNAFDYSVIKGESKKDKNKALHAMLVGMGIGDSRTKEYQAVWNARPWAK